MAFCFLHFPYHLANIFTFYEYCNPLHLDIHVYCHLLSREEKSLHHNAINFILFVKCWQNFLGFNLIGLYLSLEEEKKFGVVFTYSIKQACEIRKIYMYVVNIKQQLRNV